MVIAISLVVGITDALSMPSFQSIVPSIVERDQIPTGIALNSTQFNLSRILGPVARGPVDGERRRRGMLRAERRCPTCRSSWWRCGSCRRDPPREPRREPWDRGHPFGGVREAMRDLELRSALLTVLVSGLFCGPLLTFTPVLVRDALQGSVGHFSAAVGAFGVGGLLGAFGLLFVDPARSRRPPTTGFAVAYGVVVDRGCAESLALRRFPRCSSWRGSR